DEDVRSAVQVGDGYLLVAVVPRVRFAGEPHAEGDRTRQPLRIGAAPRDRRRGVLTGRAAVRRHQSPHDLRIAIEGERLVLEIASGAQGGAASRGESGDGVE